MSNNIVKQEQLHEIAGDLWSKAKKRDIENLEYVANTKTIKGKSNSNADLDISTELTNMAVVDQENRFTQDNVFTKVYIDGISTTLGMDIPSGGVLGHSISAQNNTRRFGNRNMSTGKKGAHIDKIVIPMSNGMTVGNNATPLTVWAVEKGATKANDVLITEPIVNRVSLQVKTGGSPFPSSITDTYQRYVEHTINKTFDKDVYFVYSFEDHGNCIAKRDLPVSEDNLCIEGSTFNAESITTSRPCDKYGVHLIYMTKKVDIKELIVNGGTVKKVNEQLPNSQGNVTINAEHIKIDDSSSANTVKAEVELKLNKSDAETLYVKKDNTTNTGGVENQNKVVKLGPDGKLNASMLPYMTETEVNEIKRLFT